MYLAPILFLNWAKDSDTRIISPSQFRDLKNGYYETTTSDVTLVWLMELEEKGFARLQ